MKSRATTLGIRRRIALVAKQRDADPPELPLPGSGNLTVQFVRKRGQCWESTYTTGDTMQNDGKKFAAKRKARKAR